MNSRPILYGPIKDGLFVMPKSFDAKDEVNFSKRRMDTVRIAQYADSSCGLSNTFDPDGAYLCGGRAKGQSTSCNKFESPDCLIRITAKVASPTRSSCMYWEKANAGDPEGKYPPQGRLDDKRIDFGVTANPLGWGCMRCEYGQELLNHPDSEGRTRWCSKKGHPVENNSCCAENEAIDKDDNDGFDYVENPPKPQFIDRSRTTDSMIMRGKYILKDGSKVSLEA